MAKTDLILTFKTDESWPVIEELASNTGKANKLLSRILKSNRIDKNNAIAVDVAALLKKNCSLLENFLKASLKSRFGGEDG